MKKLAILISLSLICSCSLSAKELERIDGITIDVINRYCESGTVPTTNGDATFDYKSLAIEHLCNVNKRRRALELQSYQKAIEYSISVSKGGKHNYAVDLSMWQSRGIALPSDMLGL